MVRNARWAATVASCVAAVVLSGCSSATSDTGTGTLPPGALATQSAGVGASAPTTATPTTAPTATPTATPTSTRTTTAPSKADLDAFIAAGQRQMKSMLPASFAEVYSDGSRIWTHTES